MRIDGRETSAMTTDESHAFRNRHIGFIFQFHYLLPELTALENVLLPARNLGESEKYQDAALDWLKHLSIGGHAHKYPGQMSGGEQQRVAIARAMILRPKYIFADEPTGNLDSHNALLAMNTLKEINRTQRTTVVLVTHDPGFSKMADREILLADGRLR
jgi:putative ABC transport system ATP-binding protein/lipoprotein-releasing system ATP-binding protein